MCAFDDEEAAEEAAATAEEDAPDDMMRIHGTLPNAAVRCRGFKSVDPVVPKATRKAASAALVTANNRDHSRTALGRARRQACREEQLAGCNSCCFVQTTYRSMTFLKRFGFSNLPPFTTLTRRPHSSSSLSDLLLTNTEPVVSRTRRQRLGHVGTLLDGQVVELRGELRSVVLA